MRNLAAMAILEPLILTLALDADSAAFFEGERRRHFPPERNIIPAHLTLFHHLPGDEEQRITAFLAELCAETAPFALSVSGLRFSAAASPMRSARRSCSLCGGCARRGSPIG